MRNLRGARLCRTGRLGAAAILLVVAAGLGVSPRTAQADDPGSGNTNTFYLTAEADSLDVVVTTRYLPVVTEVSGSPWGASTSLNSLGQSLADAGAPYSPFAYSVPGTVNGARPAQAPAVPEPPGYVSASYPDSPSASQTEAGYQISATTSANEAKGEVHLGAEQPGANLASLSAVAATTEKPDGSVVAQATAGVDALDLGGVADIGNVSSTEQMTEQNSHAPQVKGATSLGTITLLGKTTGLSTSGANVLGEGVPVPISSASLDPLNAALVPAGVKLAYLPQSFTYTDGTQSSGPNPDSSRTLQSVDSGALQVTITRQVTEPITTTLTLGRVYLSVTATSGLSPGVLGGLGSTGSTGSTQSAPANTGAAGGRQLTGGMPQGSSAPSFAGTPQSSARTGPLANTPARPAAPSSRQAPNLTRIARTGPSSQSLYMLLVLAAAAALGGSQLIRLTSVRLALSRYR